MSWGPCIGLRWKIHRSGLVLEFPLRGLLCLRGLRSKLPSLATYASEEKQQSPEENLHTAGGCGMSEIGDLMSLLLKMNDWLWSSRMASAFKPRSCVCWKTFQGTTSIPKSLGAVLPEPCSQGLRNQIPNLRTTPQAKALNLECHTPEVQGWRRVHPPHHAVRGLGLASGRMALRFPAWFGLIVAWTWRLPG